MADARQDDLPRTTESLVLRHPDCPVCLAEVSSDGTSYWCELCGGVWDDDGTAEPVEMNDTAEPVGAVSEPPEETRAVLDQGTARSLAVEIVDAVHGYTYEYAGSPAAHQADYDQVEEILTNATRQPGDVFDLVRQERVRAHAKHGNTSMESSSPDTYRRLSILAEEVGEVAAEFNDAEHENRPVDIVALRKELIQVAAMAGAWADACDAEASDG